MVPQWVIEKKRDGGALPADDIRAFIRGYTAGDIPDYQAAAFAMAVYFQGMNDTEVAALTEAMLESGDRIDSGSFDGPAADKHSTGGIGDKVSLILAPLAAACGMKVPMLSGRGLGLTGGTLDKLESIPGYRVNLSVSEIRSVVNACGCCITGQTADIAPADRKLYALRDVTGTVPSIPLIAASIMSKKLAEGLDALVLDVKCGSGAFMRTPERARALARTMSRIGDTMGVRVVALVTDMNQPLGRTVGNALEVVEAINTLKGKGPADLRAITLALTAAMLTATGLAGSTAEAEHRVAKALDSGHALEVFRKMVTRQGGDPSVIDHTDRLPRAEHRQAVTADREGYVERVDAEAIGRAALLLGAGRRRTTDTIDSAVGISELVSVGDRIAAGQTLALLHANDAASLAAAASEVARGLAVSANPVTPPPLILETIS